MGQGRRAAGLLPATYDANLRLFNGRLDIWWDNRSDFNADGEKAVFFGAMYYLKN